jgi:hypothetical protein
VSIRKNEGCEVVILVSSIQNFMLFPYEILANYLLIIVYRLLITDKAVYCSLISFLPFINNRSISYL